MDVSWPVLLVVMLSLPVAPPEHAPDVMVNFPPYCYGVRTDGAVPEVDRCGACPADQPDLRKLLCSSVLP